MNKYLNIALKALIALIVGALMAHFIGSAKWLSLLTQATVFSLLAVGVGLLLKQNGMVSFGHAFFFGSAGYVVGLLLSTKLASAEVTIFAAVAVVALFAFFLGFVVVRVPGIAFGMLTIAIAQMFYQVAERSRSITGGADGMNIDWPNTLFGVPISVIQKDGVLFMISWSTLVIVIALLYVLLSGRFGAITEAVRDNEERARFIGIRTLLPRVLIFSLSAAVTALAGVLSVLNTGFVSPESMHWSVSGMALMMVVVGGYRTLWGPALGAAAFFLTRDFVGDYADHWLAIFGAALIIVIVFSPNGIGGALQKLFARKERAQKLATAGGNK